MFESRAVSPAEAQPDAALEDDFEFAVGDGLEAGDAIDADDGGAVDADEKAGVEAGFELGQGEAAVENGAGAEVECEVDTGGFDPVDFRDVEEVGGAGGLDDEAIERTVGGEGLKELFEAGGQGVGVGITKAGEEALECGFEAFVTEGLEEVIEGVGVEGLDGVAVIGGDEDGKGHAGNANGVDDGEAVDLGHLDVEEDEVEVMGLEQIDGGAAVGGLGDEAVGLEQSAEALAGGGFIVDDEDVAGSRHARGPWESRTGRWIWTEAPPEGRG